MADSVPDRRAAGAPGLLVLVALALQALPASGATPAPPEEIVLDAADMQVDPGSNRLGFTDVSIAQGTLRIEAREASAEGTAMRFDDSRWEFRGAVRIRFAGGELRADQASIRFAGNRLAQAVARGAPAEFQQQLEGLPRPVQGKAATVTLDLAAQTIRLVQDAWLFDGRNEIRSAALLFDMRSRLARTERQEGAPAGERVRITIRPEPESPPAGAAP